MKSRTCARIGFMLALLAAAGMFLGCEYQGHVNEIKVTPSEATLSPTNNTVLLTANVGTNSSALPLRWSVGEASLGDIIQNSGTAVLYQATTLFGVNHVLVVGSDGSEGLVTITQHSADTTASGPLTVIPSSIVLTGANQTVIFTATLAGSADTASVLPLQWQVTDSSLGSIVEVAGLTATYVRNGSAAGNNTVEARTADGSAQFGALVQQK